MGQLSEAQDFFERAIKLARNVGARNFEADALSRLVAVSLGHGNKIKAQQLAKQAVEIVRQVGMTFIGPAVLVELAATTDNVSERWAALEEAEAILDSGCVVHNQFWFADRAIDLCLEIGEWDQVERYVDRLEVFILEQPLPWSDYMVARGRALAAWGRGRRGAELEAQLKSLVSTAEQVGLISAVPALKNALKTR